MTIKKVKGGFRIKHCKSGKKGFIKATPLPVSKRKASEIHSAIMLDELSEKSIRKQKWARRKKRKLK